MKKVTTSLLYASATLLIIASLFVLKHIPIVVIDLTGLGLLGGLIWKFNLLEIIKSYAKILITVVILIITSFYSPLYSQGTFGGKVAVLDPTGATTWINTNSQTCDGAGTGNLTSGTGVPTYTAYLGDKYYLGGNVLTYGFNSNYGAFMQWQFYTVGGSAPGWGTALNFSGGTFTWGVCSSGSNLKIEQGPVSPNGIQCTSTGSYRLDVNLVAYNNSINYGEFVSGNYIPFTVNALGNPTSCTASITGTTASLGWARFTGGVAYNVMIVRYAKNATPTAPSNGTSYALNATLGSGGNQGTVVYATGTGTSATNSVTTSTDYDYYFYSENWSYYSSGVKVTALAPSIFTSSISGSTFCAGTTISVPFTTANTTFSSNTFTVQLSDISGSFTNAANIGKLTSNSTSGTITAYLPEGAPTSSSYRVRVVSNGPAITGLDNGSGLTINADVFTPNDSSSLSTFNNGSGAISGLSNWTISGGGGWFTGSSNNNGDLTSSPTINTSDGKAWGLWAGGTSATENAYRSFTSPLTYGQIIGFSMDNGYVTSGGGEVGMSLQNSSNNDLMKFSFVGGGLYYTLTDSTGITLTNIPITYTGINVVIAYTGLNTYNITVYSKGSHIIYYSYSQTFNKGVTGGQVPSIIHFFNSKAGNGNTFDCFFNNLYVSPGISTQPATTTQTYCVGGSPASLSVTAYGTNISYQWYSNTSASTSGATIVGTNSNTFTPSSSTAGTFYYYCVVRSSNTCGSIGTSTSGFSGSYLYKTNVGITSATAAASPICNSATTLLTANGVVGTNNVVTWYTGTGGSGTNLGTGAQNKAPGTYYARVTGDCGSAVEASVTVGAKTNVGITSATAAASPICNSATTLLTANGVVGTNNVVTWYTGTGGTGTNLGTGAQNKAPGTYYARVTGDCGSAVEASVTVAGDPTSVAGSIAGSTTVCKGTNSTVLTLSGNTGTIQWQTSTNNSSYSDISGQTGPTYTATDLTVTTYYKAVVTSGVCASATTSAATLTAGNKTWTGAVSTSWTNSSNWCGGVPATGENVTIPSGTPNKPEFAGDVTLTNITSADTIHLNGHTLTVNGSLGSGVFSGSQTSSLILGSGANGTLNFDASSDSVSNGIKDLTINGGSVTLGTSVHVYGNLKLTHSTQDALLNLADKNLVLHSNFAGTASVDQLGSGYGSISNASNVSVQRYNKDRRAWVLLTAPLTTNGALSGLNGDIKNNWQAYTTIFGPGGTTNGLDAGPTSNACMKTWNGYAWSAVTNTTANNSLFGNASGSTAANKTFFLFMRGNRSIPTTGTTHGSDSLMATGALQMGLKTYTFTGASYALVGNPYPAPISLEAFYTGNSHAGTTFYYWDPNYNSLGAYVTVTRNGANDYTCVPSGGSSFNPSNVYIQSGQGFFIVPQSCNGDSTVNFTESMKSTGNSSNMVFGNTNSQSVLAINLNSFDANGNKHIVDGVGEMFSSNYSNSVNTKTEDITKLYNNQENLCILRSNNYLAIEKRSDLTISDTIFFYLAGLQSGVNYQYEFNPSNLNTTGLTGYLVDNYLNTSTAIDLSKVSTVSFTKDANTASFAPKRFMIIFKATNPLSISGLSIRASVKSKSAIIDWKVVAEKNVDHYEVERSTNAIGFEKIAATVAKNVDNSNYTFTDNTTTNGVVYYRIKAISKDGTIQYSSIAKVIIGNSNEGFSIYPNPIVGREVNIVISNLSAGTYSLAIYNNYGQLLSNQSIQHAGGSITTTVQMSANMSTGIYKVKLTGEDKMFTETVIVK